MIMLSYKPRRQRTDFKTKEVVDLYSGSAKHAFIESMGLNIHAGLAKGLKDLKEATGKINSYLAQKAGIKGQGLLLDIGCGPGSPLLYLVKGLGQKSIGVDITFDQLKMAKGVTEGLVRFVQTDALSMPFKDCSFDILWSQDAFCHIPKRSQLIKECFRLLKQGGTLAFTDWLETEALDDKERMEILCSFAYPGLESLRGYKLLLEEVGFASVEAEDLSEHFKAYLSLWVEEFNGPKRQTLMEKFGDELCFNLEKGAQLWHEKAQQGKVSWGLLVAKKP